MFVVIVGAGKVGLNTARSLTHMGHEVIVIEQRRMRYNLLLPELEEKLLLGDGTEIWVLERAGIARADMVVAVTGDDEDNVIISADRQDEVRRAQGRRAREQPAQPEDLRPARHRRHGVRGDAPAVADPARDARAQVRAAALVQARERGAGGAGGGGDLAVRQQADRRDRGARGRPADGHSARRHGAYWRRRAETILPGDYVLCLLEPGKETELIGIFLPEERPEELQAESGTEMIREST